MLTKFFIFFGQSQMNKVLSFINTLTQYICPNPRVATTNVHPFHDVIVKQFKRKTGTRVEKTTLQKGLQLIFVHNQQRRHNLQKYFVTDYSFWYINTSDDFKFFEDKIKNGWNTLVMINVLTNSEMFNSVIHLLSNWVMIYCHCKDDKVVSLHLHKDKCMSIKALMSIFYKRQSVDTTGMGIYPEFLTEETFINTYMLANGDKTQVEDTLEQLNISHVTPAMFQHIIPPFSNETERIKDVLRKTNNDSTSMSLLLASSSRYIGTWFVAFRNLDAIQILCWNSATRRFRCGINIEVAGVQTFQVNNLVAYDNRTSKATMTNWLENSTILFQRNYFTMDMLNVFELILSACCKEYHMVYVKNIQLCLADTALQCMLAKAIVINNILFSETHIRHIDDT